MSCTWVVDGVMDVQKIRGGGGGVWEQIVMVKCNYNAVLNLSILKRVRVLCSLVSSRRVCSSICGGMRSGV